MAGRIRSIKPEILDDEEVCALSDQSWRLWVSMWLLADDHGNLRAGDRYLAALVWQDTGRSPRISEILRELRRGRIEVYENNGERYAHIRNWEKHQRIDNAGKARVPGPEHESSRSWESFRGESPRVSASLGDLPLDQRPPTNDQRPTTTTPTPKEIGPAHACMRVLAALNESRAATIRGARPLAPIAANAKHIADRLKDGYTVEDCLHVIAVCAAEVKASPATAKWFNAVSPFRPDNFARKLAGNGRNASIREQNERRGAIEPMSAIERGKGGVVNLRSLSLGASSALIAPVTRDSDEK